MIVLALKLLVFGAFWLEVSSKRPADAISVFVAGEGGYYCHKIPYLFRTNSGSLLAFAEGRGKDGRAACDDFAGTDLVWKRSLDNGQTWNTLGLVYTNSTLEEYNVVGNAAPVQDRDTGRIWLPFCRNNEQVFISFSDDDGQTWSSPVYHPELVHSDWKWVGLGPPGGIQLTSGRLLIPGYHTIKWKGDGCASRGHTIYSDDHGATWSIGSAEFGQPYLANECQAVELQNGSVLINARTVTNQRVQVVSNDGGLTFGEPFVPDLLLQPLEGCEGSLVRDSSKDVLYFSDPFTRSVVRTNMTIFKSHDNGITWDYFVNVDTGSVAYSSLQVNAQTSELELLYERSEQASLVFEPDEIVYWKISI